MMAHNSIDQLPSALHVGRTEEHAARTTLNRAGIAISEIKRDQPENQYSSPVPHEDAFLITLNIQEWSKRILWIDDKPVRAQPLQAGTANIFDLRRKYVGYGVSPFHMIALHLPRDVLDCICDQEDVPRIDEMAHDPCNGLDDMVIRELGLTLFPAFQRPDEANILFVDHVTSAIAAHVIQAYGIVAKREKAPDMKLAPWQATLVGEIIRSDLSGNLSIGQLARECGLPPSAFLKAFANTMGAAPHKWLLERRIENAMILMRQTSLSLDTIATYSGFCGERHFTRAFAQIVGASPKAWRQTVLS